MTTETTETTEGSEATDEYRRVVLTLRAVKLALGIVASVLTVLRLLGVL
jgi:hypothetical protein